MTERIIDLSLEPAKLSVRLDQLVIQRHDHPEVTAPLEEVAALVVANKAVLYTQAVLAGLASAGGVFVACNEKFMPVGMMIPLEAHHLQAERFVKQAEAPLPLRKRLWQQLVEAKVTAQGNVLLELRKDDHGLRAMAERVRSGDPDNIEGQASRRYWPALFDDPKFLRDRDAEDQNRLLNYGYAVLRAVVARAVCASGLHPSMAIHHHNRYDSFRLVDDLMEPLRPMVDRTVAVWSGTHGPDAPLDKDSKAALIGALMSGYRIGEETRSLFDTAARMASSLAGVYAGERKELEVPRI